MTRLPAFRALLAIASLAVLAGCPRPRGTTPGPATPVATVGTPPPAVTVIPAPASLALVPADTFVVDSTVPIYFDSAAGADVQRVAQRLAALLVRTAGARPHPGVDTARAIWLRIDAAAAGGAPEGYTLDVTRGGVTLAAATPAGLFYGMQTLRQLLPWSVEHPAHFPARPMRIPGVRITDAPRFAWRGAMLDVSRHFLPAADVRRFVDLLALYKVNRLHLHLSDDQGWRLEIRSWPRLTEIGGSTQVGGGPGGFYTQAEFAALVAYARERHIMVIPEIDMPGHTNAALASYAGLNCDGKAPPLYTGIRVGFSAICPTSDSTWKFIADVVREIGALTPETPWLPIGGDEVEKLTHDQYLRFVERAEGIVRASGKRMIGWGEVAPARLDTTSLVQHWRKDSSAVHAARGGKVLLSPGKKVYLDMKYDTTTVLGLRWAGMIEVRDAYDWDPATYIEGVRESSILGVESPLWSETVTKREDYEFLLFPRVLAVAEIGWTPQAGRAWEDFRERLARHGPRLQALGVNYYRSTQVPWVLR